MRDKQGKKREKRRKTRKVKERLIRDNGLKKERFDVIVRECVCERERET